MDTTGILASFDEQMRRRAAPDNLYVGNGWSAVLWRPDDGEVEPLVARMREVPGHVEWKYYSHDGPELRERLLAAGLEPEDEETVVVAEAASIAPPSDDVELSLATDAFDELAARVFGRRYALPDKAVAVVAMVDGQPVSGGRVDFEDGRGTAVSSHRVDRDPDHLRSLRSVSAERFDLAALVVAAGRADAVRALRLAARLADVDLRSADRVRRAPLVAAGLGGFPLRDGHRSGPL